jgi:hypothetical protein
VLFSPLVNLPSLLAALNANLGDIKSWLQVD